MDDAQEVTVRTATNYSASADGYAEFWSPVILPPGRRMLEALPWDGARRILDIGTGTGALIPEIRRLAPIASVMGIDPSLGMLARARRARAPLAAMDAMALGIRAGTFDVAVLAFVLFHIPDQLTGLAEVRRVLRRGGPRATLCPVSLPRRDLRRDYTSQRGATPGSSARRRYRSV